MALFQKSISMLLTLAFAVLMVGPQSAAAHVVPMTKLNEDVQAAAQTRLANITAVQKVLNTAQAQQLLSAANLDKAKAEKAVSLLSDQDLSQLAQQANQAEADIAAGLTRGQTSLIILAGAVVVIILVIAAVA